MNKKLMGLLLLAMSLDCTAAIPQFISVSVKTDLASGGGHKWESLQASVDRANAQAYEKLEELGKNIKIDSVQYIVQPIAHAEEEYKQIVLTIWYEEEDGSSVK